MKLSLIAALVLTGCAAGAPERPTSTVDASMPADGGTPPPTCADVSWAVQCVASDGVVQEPSPPVTSDTVITIEDAGAD